MKKIICTTSANSVGATFIDWSMHFLNGQTHFYHANSGKWIELVDNPLNSTNAHNHKKNHPSGLKETMHTLKMFNQQPNGIFSMYPTLLRLWMAAEELGITLDQNNHNSAINNQLLAHCDSDFIKQFDLYNKKNIKVVYIDTSPDMQMYFANQRHVGSYKFKNKLASNVNDLCDEHEQFYFSDSLNTWKDLNNVWDIRERRALNFRPSYIDTKLNFKFSHFWVDCRTMWTLGEDTIHNIMDYVELSIEPKRMQLWLPIFKKWQQIQLTRLNFCYVLPHIVAAIVNDWDYDLGNLSFEQEVIIQHCLIYQQGLNLKTWQLDKFPSNAKDLHRLLEPNIHQFDSST